jgi:hypothetical protein
VNSSANVKTHLVDTCFVAELRSLTVVSPNREQPYNLPNEVLDRVLWKPAKFCTISKEALDNKKHLERPRGGRRREESLWFHLELNYFESKFGPPKTHLEISCIISTMIIDSIVGRAEFLSHLVRTTVPCKYRIEYFAPSQG